jgi:hypothetical protein
VYFVWKSTLAERRTTGVSDGAGGKWFITDDRQSDVDTMNEDGSAKTASSS